MDTFLPKKDGNGNDSPHRINFINTTITGLTIMLQKMLLNSKLQSSSFFGKKDAKFDILFESYLKPKDIVEISCKKNIKLFLTELIQKSGCEVEILISTFLLFRRILTFNSSLTLNIKNFRPLLFIAFNISQKNIDDIGLLLSEYSSIWQLLSKEQKPVKLKKWCQLESNFLTKINWKVNISQKDYHQLNNEIRLSMAETFKQPEQQSQKPRTAKKPRTAQKPITAQKPRTPQKPIVQERHTPIEPVNIPTVMCMYQIPVMIVYPTFPITIGHKQDNHKRKYEEVCERSSNNFIKRRVYKKEEFTEEPLLFNSYIKTY